MEDTPCLSLDLVPCSPKITTPLSPSPRPQNPLPMHELLLLSPSPLRRSKSRFVEKLDMAEKPVEPNGLCRRCKNQNGSMGLLGCALPRNGRRSRRRLEPEIREERDLGMVEEMGKVKKRGIVVGLRKIKFGAFCSISNSIFIVLNNKRGEECGVKMWAAMSAYTMMPTKCLICCL